MNARSSLTLLLLTSTALLSGCNNEPAKIDPADLGPPPVPYADDVVAEMPSEPELADEGLPGHWEPTGTTPEARMFVVEPTEGNGRGLLVAHARWGADLEMRNLARRLADKGYLVAMPDIYEGVISTTNLTANELLQGVSRERAAEISSATMARLSESEGITHVGALCVGAGAAWTAMALDAESGVDAVIFDSPLVADPTSVTIVEAPLLMMSGSLASAFPDSIVQAWNQAFDENASNLVTETIDDAGTTLLDPNAIGFRQGPEGVAIERVLAFLDEAMS